MNTLSSMTQIVSSFCEHQQSMRYQQLSLHQDTKYQVAWCYMHAAPRPCFSPALLDELINWSRYLGEHGREQGYAFHVTASKIHGVFSLGGDLARIRNLIAASDGDGLYAYGRRCIDVLYANITSFGGDITSISLVQGHALGGGFEGALSSEVLIAERSALLGFPEILFNLFPGMGGLSLLTRKLGAKAAERLILSGKLYGAEELHAMGLVDVLAADGEGELAVYEYIERERRARNGFRALRKARDRLAPITYQELDGIVQTWVEAALKLEKRDLRMIDRLVSRQTPGIGKGDKAA